MDYTQPVTVTLPLGDLMLIDRVLAEADGLSARDANGLRERLNEQVRPQIVRPQLPPPPQG